MNSFEFFDLLGQIDDKFYEEVLADGIDMPLRLNRKPFSVKRLILPIAVCLVLALGVAWLFKSNSDTDIISEKDAARCVTLYLVEYPELKDSEDAVINKRVMDINFDGIDEVIVTSSTARTPPQIYSKTKIGMEKTGALECGFKGTGLTDPEQLFLYEGDGEKYWYYSFLIYDGLGEADENIFVHAVARINCLGGIYYTDFPLGYGSLDAFGSGRRYAKDLEFRFSGSISDGISFMSDWDFPPFEQIYADDFKELWEKYADMPPIRGFKPDKRYPMIDLSDIPSDPENGVNATLAIVKDYGGTKLRLFGRGIFRDDSGLYAKYLGFGIVNDEENDFRLTDWCGLSNADGNYKLDEENLDNCVRLFELDDADIIVLNCYTDHPECRFYSASENGALALWEYYDKFDILSDDLFTFSNSIVDRESGIEYRFYPENFYLYLPNDVNFVMRHYVTARTVRSASYPSSGEKIGGAEELERWNEVIGSGKTARLEIFDSSIFDNSASADIEHELTPEAASAVMDILYALEPKLLDEEPTAGEPSDGVIVTAFDEDDNFLFSAAFEGTQFNVQFESSGLVYRFEGGLEPQKLYDHIRVIE